MENKYASPDGTTISNRLEVTRDVFACRTVSLAAAFRPQIDQTDRTHIDRADRTADG